MYTYIYIEGERERDSRIFTCCLRPCSLSLSLPLSLSLSLSLTAYMYTTCRHIYISVGRLTYQIIGGNVNSHRPAVLFLR